MMQKCGKVIAEQYRAIDLFRLIFPCRMEVVTICAGGAAARR